MKGLVTKRQKLTRLLITFFSDFFSDSQALTTYSPDSAPWTCSCDWMVCCVDVRLETPDYLGLAVRRLTDLNLCCIPWCFRSGWNVISIVFVLTVNVVSNCEITFATSRNDHRRHPQYFTPLHSIHTVGNLTSKISLSWICMKQGRPNFFHWNRMLQ